jgi:hypothetical protein
MTKVEIEPAVGHASLAAALAAVQVDIPAVSKGSQAEVPTKTGGKYTYKYAPLEMITPLILPLLGRHGLSFSAQPTMMGDAFVLRYTLAHESGETVEGAYPLPDPTLTKPQEIGSAITYARRYALCAVTGVAPGGDDDDAQAANEAPAAKARAPRAVKPAPAPAPSLVTRDWAADLLPVRDLDALKGVYDHAAEANELGFEFGEPQKESVLSVIRDWGLQTPSGAVSVAALVMQVKKKIEDGDLPKGGAPVAAEPSEGWAVAPIPNGDES